MRQVFSRCRVRTWSGHTSKNGLKNLTCKNNLKQRAEPPANSPQQPMRGRSLPRRFRGSDTATLRVALPERTGRARVSGRTLARLLSASIAKDEWPQLTSALESNMTVIRYLAALTQAFF